jgi:hypothetical protein
MLRYYHLETGKLPTTEAKKAQKHFTESAKYYLLAAESFAKDDEKHIYEQERFCCVSSVQ